MRNTIYWRLLIKFVLTVIAITVIGGSFVVHDCSPARAQLLHEPSQVMTALISQINRLANEQRNALSKEVLATISQVTLNAERLIRESGVVAGGLEERVAADTQGAILQAEHALKELAAQLQDGTSATVQQAAQEANRTLSNASASVQDALGATRPILANAERVGDELVVRTEGAVSSAVLRIAAGVILLLVAVGAVVLVVRRGSNSWGRAGALVAMALLAVLAFVFAPSISWAFAREERFKDPNLDCRVVSNDGKSVLDALERGDAVDRALAERVRDAAARCHLLSSNAVEAAVAERYLTAALEALGAPLLCRSAAQCLGGKVCDLTSGECLPRGVYCEFPADCDAGKVCDSAKRRCVETGNYDCAPPQRPCQAGQVCLSGRCVAPTQAGLGGPCKPAGKLGACGDDSAGRWELDARGQRICAAKVLPKAEECNGYDDNCNGYIDDGLQLQSQDCVATTARGECRKGRTACEKGKVVCLAGTRGEERCFNDLDEDCDGRLNNGCGGEDGESREIHCGSFGSGCHQLGGACKQHFVRDTVDMMGPNSGGLRGWWKWVDPKNPRDCRAEICCESKDLFQGGNWKFTVRAKAHVTSVP